jgi:hypothetical protein
MAQRPQLATPAARFLDASLEPFDLPAALKSHGIVVIRLGHGANCSSIGSNVDLLYAGAAAAGAILTAVAVGLQTHAGARDAKADAEVLDEEPVVGDAGGTTAIAPPTTADDAVLPKDPQ